MNYKKLKSQKKNYTQIFASKLRSSFINFMMVQFFIPTKNFEFLKYGILIRKKNYLRYKINFFKSNKKKIEYKYLILSHFIFKK